MLPPIKIDPKTFLKEHCSLPALPALVGQIQDAIYKDDVNIDEVSQLVSGDPSILAQVLKVVNSAYYGLPRQIEKIRIAIAFLGLNEIYRLVLSMAVLNGLAIPQKKELEVLWFHSFLTATCTKYLAKKYEPLISHEEIWPAAMLHDIGKLVYLKFFPAHYRAVKDYKITNGSTFSEAEKGLSLPSSAYLGVLLCEHWRLPDQTRSACEFHTEADLLATSQNNPPSPMQRMVCLGNLVAVLSSEELSAQNKRRISSAIIHDLECKESEFMMLMGKVYELKTEVENMAGQFG